MNKAFLVNIWQINKYTFCLWLLMLITLGFFAYTARIGSDIIWWNAEGDIYWSTYQKIIAGKVPFKDFFLEYPPLAPYLLSLPVVFGVITEKATYLYYWVLFLILIYNISYWWNWSLVDAYSRFNKLVFLVTWFVVISYSVLNFSTVGTRYDYLIATICFWAFLVYTEYLKKNIPKQSLFVVSVILAVGTLAKIYPVFFVGIVFVIELSFKRYKLLALNIACFSVIVVSVLGGFYLSGTENFEKFVSWQGLKRDIQIESSYAGVLFALEKNNLIGEQKVTGQNGALEIVSKESSGIAKYTNYLMVGLIIALYIFIYCLARKGNEIIAITVLSALSLSLILIIFNKVFSPQYLAWTILLLPLLNLIPQINYKKIKKILVICLIFSLISILTNLIYPHHYGKLIDKKPELIALLNIRTLVIIWSLLYCLHWLYKISKTKFNYGYKSIKQSEVKINIE